MAGPSHPTEELLSGKELNDQLVHLLENLTMESEQYEEERNIWKTFENMLFPGGVGSASAEARVEEQITKQINDAFDCGFQHLRYNALREEIENKVKELETLEHAKRLMNDKETIGKEIREREAEIWMKRNLMQEARDKMTIYVAEWQEREATEEDYEGMTGEHERDVEKKKKGNTVQEFTDNTEGEI